MKNTFDILKTKRDKILKILNLPIVEFLLWVFVFTVPLLFLSYIDENTIGYAVEFWHFVWSICLVFFLNYRFLATKYVFGAKRSVLNYVLVNILLLSLISTGLYYGEDYARKKRELDVPKYLEETYVPLLPHHSAPPPKFIPGLDVRGKYYHPHPPFNKMFFLNKVLPLIFMVGMALAMKAITEVRNREKKIKELRNSYAEAELRNLRKQFSPHFIFNILNNIHALVDISPHKAQESIVRLSGMMRMVLNGYKTYKYITIRDSIMMIEDYIALMRLRIPESLDLKVSMPHKYDRYFIPPLLFIVLVENAFKHGIRNSRPSFIHIKYEIDEENGNLIGEVVNSYFDKVVSNINNTGEGLDNLRKRLDIIFPNQYQLILKHDKEKYIARMIIPLRREEEILC